MNDMYYIVQHSAHAINTTLTAHIKAACIITNNSYMVATFNRALTPIKLHSSFHQFTKESESAPLQTKAQVTKRRICTSVAQLKQ